MFCKTCGQELPNDAKFCVNCGAPVEDTAEIAVEEAVEVVPEAAVEVVPEAAPEITTALQPVYTDPVYQVQNETSQADDPAKNDAAKSILTFGILAVAFASSFLSFVGIIFGAIGLSKAKNYANEYGTYTGKARVGKYLSLGGLIEGIVMTVGFIILMWSLGVIASIAVQTFG